jgi:hypothetical protein
MAAELGKRKARSDDDDDGLPLELRKHLMSSALFYDDDIAQLLQERLRAFLDSMGSAAPSKEEAARMLRLATASKACLKAAPARDLLVAWTFADRAGLPTAALQGAVDEMAERCAAEAVVGIKEELAASPMAPLLAHAQARQFQALAARCNTACVKDVRSNVGVLHARLTAGHHKPEWYRICALWACKCLFVDRYAMLARMAREAQSEGDWGALAVLVQLGDVPSCAELVAALCDRAKTQTLAVNVLRLLLERFADGGPCGDPWPFGH